MSKRVIHVMKEREAEQDQTERGPVKQKVVVLRKAKDGEQFDRKAEIPVSLAIEQYGSQVLEHKGKDPVVIFLLGGPGSGKGTLSSFIRNDYNVGYLCAGDLLRGEVQSGSELGQRINEQIRNGEIVPVEVTAGLLKREIDTQKKDFYLIDGFPRAIEQAQYFEKNVATGKMMLFLECSDEVLLQRLAGRSAGSGRVDDNPESIKKRIAVYHTSTIPVLEYFESQGRAKRINAERSPEDIYGEVKSIIEAILKET